MYPLLTNHRRFVLYEEAKPKRSRGPGKKPKLFCTSLRIPQEVKAYFDTYHPDSKQAKMRDILVEYVRNHGVNNGS